MGRSGEVDGGEVMELGVEMVYLGLGVGEVLVEGVDEGLVLGEGVFEEKDVVRRGMVDKGVF